MHPYALHDQHPHQQYAFLNHQQMQAPHQQQQTQHQSSPMLVGAQHHLQHQQHVMLTQPMLQPQQQPPQHPHSQLTASYHSAHASHGYQPHPPPHPHSHPHTHAPQHSQQLPPPHMHYSLAPYKAEHYAYSSVESAADTAAAADKQQLFDDSNLCKLVASSKQLSGQHSSLLELSQSNSNSLSRELAPTGVGCLQATTSAGVDSKPQLWRRTGARASSRKRQSKSATTRQVSSTRDSSPTSRGSESPATLASPTSTALQLKEHSLTPLGESSSTTTTTGGPSSACSASSIDISHHDGFTLITNDNKVAVRLSNEELINIRVQDLNKVVAGIPKQTICKLKQRRRTLKNRGYAQNCRSKRIKVRNELEEENKELRNELKQQEQLLRHQSAQIRQLESQLAAATQFHASDKSFG